MSIILIAAFLGLVVIVINRREINIVWELERYFEKRGYRWLAKPIRAVNKIFTSIEKREAELKLINSWTINRRKLDEILQRELYLLEEKDALEKQALTGDLSPDEEALLIQVKDDLLHIRPCLWKNAQIFGDTHHHWKAGSWLLEFQMISREEEWERGQHDCFLRLGCCGRGCGCCKKSREGNERQHLSLASTKRSHCTVECGCCIRWRGFRRLEDYNKDN